MFANEIGIVSNESAVLLPVENFVRSHDSMIGWTNEKSFSSNPSSSGYKCILSNGQKYELSETDWSSES